MKHFLYLILLGFLSFGASSQQVSDKFTISGYVRDGSSGESLIGANVFVEGEQLVGTTTNLYGFYSLTLPAGEYRLTTSYLGYANFSRALSLSADQRINMELLPDALALEEVVVTSRRQDENVESTEMGTVELSIDQIRSIPALFGEVDVIKAIQLLPGVQAAGEGNSGIYVRGGGIDQNLVLLDDAIVYNTGHLFGFFSVFNADAVRNTTLIKGGMPAEYGGRLSSVIDVSMKEGNLKRYEVEGGVGLISSRITFQGPFKRDVSSFLVSFRRTYAFDIAQPFLKRTDFAGTNYRFYDLNLKVNYIFSDKDRLYLSGYFGRDVFVYNSVPRNTEVRIPWGNATSTLRWNHLFNDKLFMNTSFIFNNYNFSFGAETEDFTFTIRSGIRDFNLKFDLDWYANSRNKLRFGYHYTFHTYTPNTARATAEDTEVASDVSPKHGHEMAWYMQNEADLSPRVRVHFGLRLGLFQHTGPYEERIPVPGGEPDTVRYRPLQPIKTYVNPEPRLNVRIITDPQGSLKAGITLNHQYAHLVSSSNNTLPTDVWVPSSSKVKPQRALQYAVGYFRNFKENTYEGSVEVYYKHLWNQIEFNESFGNPELNTEIEDEFVFGKGRSYGVEVFFKKALGDLNGWVGYTFSKTDRQFPELNEGRRFPAKFDRTHDLSMNLSWSVSDVVSLGGTWVFATGNAFTIPTEGYLFETAIVTGYSERNGYRMKPYHRLDLSATFTPRKMQSRKFKSNFNLSIYNVYSRKNVYFIYYDIQGDALTSDVSVDAVQVSIFPIIPAFTWNFKF